MKQADFVALGIVGTTTVHRWVTGAGAPGSADIVIDVAHALAPGEVAEALTAAGFPLTAAHIRAKHITPDDPFLQRIQGEAELSKEERNEIAASYLQQKAAIARLFELDVADRVRKARGERRARLSGDDPEEGNGRAAL